MSSKDPPNNGSFTQTKEIPRSLDDMFQFTSATKLSPDLLPEIQSSTSSSSSLTTDTSEIHSRQLRLEHNAPAGSLLSPKEPGHRSNRDLKALEAFLEDESPVSLSNIPMRHSSSSLMQAASKTPPPTPSKSPLVDLHRREDGSFIYTITPSDTLEGLSLRFGVKLADLKKANKLFSTRDFGIRKTVVIPICAEQWEKFEAELKYQQKLQEAHRQEAMELFMERMKVDEAVAKLYLEDSHYHLTRAMDRYQLENTQATSFEEFRVPSRPILSTYRPSKRDSAIQKAISKTPSPDDIFDL